jgi:diguanylate cyclase (GGDEF)-like protein
VESLKSEKLTACNSVADNQNAISFLQELDRALREFLQWQSGMFRALICSGDLHETYFAEDSHLLCGFGQWAAALPAHFVEHDAAFADILALHERMHAVARRMLLAQESGKPVGAAQFDEFMEVSRDFKLSLLKYQRRIISEVCTLDPLTGTGNRYAMDLRLTEEWERARRSGLPCCLCLLDLDHFKDINDQHGHTVGDAVLRSVSRFLKSDGRAYDNLFRYGGEEFLICMPNTSLTTAETVLNRLREGLAALPIPLSGGGPLSVTASFGVTQLLVDEPIVQSIERADHALICAKGRGRNRVCAWDMGSPAA